MRLKPRVPYVHTHFGRGDHVRDYSVFKDHGRRVAEDIDVGPPDADAVIDAWRDVDAYLSAPGYGHLALGGLAAAVLVAAGGAAGYLALRRLCESRGLRISC